MDKKDIDWDQRYQENKQEIYDRVGNIVTEAGASGGSLKDWAQATLTETANLAIQHKEGFKQAALDLKEQGLREWSKDAWDEGKDSVSAAARGAVKDAKEYAKELAQKSQDKKETDKDAKEQAEKEAKEKETKDK